jgi:RNA polymerase sigma-70 factor (ECF subfamily)
MVDEAQLETLIARVALGDRDAFRRVYERTSAKLFGVCLRIMKDRGDAEEVLQETYVRVWSHAQRYAQAKASPITWMVTIARNLAIDRLRARKTPTATMDAALDLPDDTPSAEHRLAAADERSRLEDCLGQLDDESRLVVRGAFFGEVTYEHLAKSEGIPLGTVKSRIRRSLMKLRTCLER